MSDGATLALVIGAIVLGLIAIVLFFLQTIIAFRLDQRNRWLSFLINLVFGATVLGWAGALIWAMNKLDDPLKGGVKYDPQTHDPMM
jgi:hypothetical protein